MARNKSGRHDRRGFDFLLQFHLASGVISLLILIFYHWMIGLAALMYCCLAFIVLEIVSSPPVNNPDNFALWVQRRGARKPVLLCVGDSILHGSFGANCTPEIPVKLSAALGLPPPTTGSFFFDPLWVVNAGQNFLTSQVILQERLHRALSCYPDFILIMVGMNDIKSLYLPATAKALVKVNELSQVPSMTGFERNIKGILDHLQQASPLSKVGICTLMPIGEDLNSPINGLVREANEILERIASEAQQGKVTLLPIYEKMEAILEKKKPRNRIPLRFNVLFSTILSTAYYMTPFFTYNRLSVLTGNHLLWDGVHPNEDGCDILVDAVVEWLMKVNVAKAIAVKQ